MMSKIRFLVEKRESTPTESLHSAEAPNVGAIIAFDVLYFAGLISLAVILLTACFSARVRRQSTWYMVIGSWFLNSLASLILVGQQTGPFPRFATCLAQAVLIDSTPVLCAFYAGAFALEVYLSALLALKTNSTISRAYLILIHAVPWAAFIGVLSITTNYGLQNPTIIDKYPAGFFCWNAVPNDWRKYLIGGAVVIGILTSIILEALILLTLRHTWKHLGNLSTINRDKPYISPDSIARMIIFSIGIVVALALTFLQYLTLPTINEDTALGLVQATLPCFAALVFGSQKDILQVWLPRRLFSAA
ncbi:hypothetical protein BDZ97DRAFT_1800671 [Flammula alnicola]|nr:hypothetical protein BDZ97DRAFT_1800671 [Flammula alnicola]